MTYVGREFQIYALAHPVTEELKYVGSTTKSLQMRLAAHLSEARAYRASPDEDRYCARNVWILGLLDASLVPSIVLLEGNSAQRRFDVERRWVNRLLNEGKRLLNAGLTVPAVFATASDYVDSIRALREVASLDVRHVGGGGCPTGSGVGYGSRNVECDACRALLRADRLLGVTS